MTEPNSPAPSPLALDALAAASLRTTPYEYVHVPGFIPPAALAAIDRDFPRMSRGGSFPADILRGGPAFDRLVAAVQEPPLRQVIEDKFGIDLAGHPTMVTIRGVIRPNDGQIHTDSRTKLITLLIYLNPAWDGQGGCLRLLNSATDLADYALEIPPVAGNMVAFRPGARSYHGHLPARGSRRVLQLNWITDRATRDRELARHRRSAWFKRLNPFA